MNNVSWYFVLLILTTDQIFVSTELSKDLLETIFFRLYGYTLNEYVDAKLEDAGTLLEKMNKSKPTMLHIHGFTENVEVTSVTTIVQAYLDRGDHNVLAADYRNISAMRYFQLVKVVPDLGISVAGGLNKMFAAGLDPEKFQLIGHSIGAQISSHVGNNTDFQLPWITGLDPAGLNFNLDKKHLSKDDARFVEIIHTDYGLYGIGISSGHVDFFPNGGHRIQPGCPLYFLLGSDEDFCSHRRSWKYYSESVTNENAFIAVKCSTKVAYATGLCANNQRIRMGYAVPRTERGTFYLKTAKKSPFGLGNDGA